MAASRLNRAARDQAVEKSLDAAIELDEVIGGTRTDAPALSALASSLIGSRPDAQSDSRALLNDARLASLYFRAVGRPDNGAYATERLDQILFLFAEINAAGLARFSPTDLAAIRDFCLGLNRELSAEAFCRVPESPFARNPRHLAFPHAD